MITAAPGPADAARTSRPSVPALPPELGDALTFLAADDPKFSVIVAFVGRHAMIAARLIALANSAWSAPARPIVTVDAACARLGTRAVRSTVVALTARSAFPGEPCAGFRPELLWRRSFLTAEIGAVAALRLARDGHLAGTLRSLGILRNLGLQWLAHVEPVPTARALALAVDVPEPGLGEHLRAASGMSVCEATAFLLRAWQLPEEMSTAIEDSAIPAMVTGAAPGELLGLAARAAELFDPVTGEPDAAPDLARLDLPPALDDAAFIEECQRARAEATRLADALFGTAPTVH